ncbi:hypothetical protein J2W14_004276, partial [Pseudarthrobacter oxydans]|nr:hypothetical protein [Pseudarthrobacter oxydans]
GSMTTIITEATPHSRVSHQQAASLASVGNTPRPNQSQACELDIDPKAGRSRRSSGRHEAKDAIHAARVDAGSAFANGPGAMARSARRAPEVSGAGGALAAVSRACRRGRTRPRRVASLAAAKIRTGQLASARITTARSLCSRVERLARETDDVRVAWRRLRVTIRRIRFPHRGAPDGIIHRYGRRPRWQQRKQPGHARILRFFKTLRLLGPLVGPTR